MRRKETKAAKRAPGDLLIFLSEGGVLHAGKASPRGFGPAAVAPVLGTRSWTVPTVHDGKLYLRDLEKIVCLDART